MAKDYTDSYLFKDCGDYGIPDGCHFAHKTETDFIAIVFTSPPNYNLKRIPMNDLMDLKAAGKIWLAKDYIERFIQQDFVG